MAMLLKRRSVLRAARAVRDEELVFIGVERISRLGTGGLSEKS
jgi:hypothetical protein